MVYDGDWLLSIRTGTHTSDLLWKIGIPVWESEVSPACYLHDTGFHMYHLNKLVKTIKGLITFFSIVTRASSELIDEDLQVLINQLRGILHRLRGIVEKSQLATSPHPTYCRQRRNRLIFPRPGEALRVITD